MQSPPCCSLCCLWNSAASPKVLLAQRWNVSARKSNAKPAVTPISSGRIPLIHLLSPTRRCRAPPTGMEMNQYLCYLVFPWEALSGRTKDPGNVCLSYLGQKRKCWILAVLICIVRYRLIACMVFFFSFNKYHADWEYKLISLLCFPAECCVGLRGNHKSYSS